MRPGEEAVARVEALLRQKLAERFPRQSRERAQFDRKIGKAGSGWTGKFLRGDPKAGAPSLQTILAAIAGLGLSPGEFFREALEDNEKKKTEEVRRFLAFTEEARDELRPLVEALVLEVLDRRGRKA